MKIDFDWIKQELKVQLYSYYYLILISYFVWFQ